MLSEINQKKKDNYQMVSFICRLWRNQTKYRVKKDKHWKLTIYMTGWRGKGQNTGGRPYKSFVVENCSDCTGQKDKYYSKFTKM